MADDGQHRDIPFLSTLPPSLRSGGRWRPASAGPLTVGRSLAAVASGAGAGIVVVALVVLLAIVASPGGGEGLGFVITAFAGSVLVACLVASLVVRASVRQHVWGGRFAGVFSAVLALLLVAWIARMFLGFSGRLGDAAHVDLLGWVLVPLLWSVPAAAAGVVRARWIGWIAGAGAVVAVLRFALGQIALG